MEPVTAIALAVRAVADAVRNYSTGKRSQMELRLAQLEMKHAVVFGLATAALRAGEPKQRTEAVAALEVARAAVRAAMPPTPDGAKALALVEPFIDDALGAISRLPETGPPPTT